MNVVEARRHARRIPNMVDDTDFFSLSGGLNLVDTPLQMKPGQLLACKNYEPFTRGGYERVAGYERFDGQLKPSDSAYYQLRFANGIPAQYPFPDDAVTGATSGATGVVLRPLIQSGGAGMIVLGRVTGTFVDGETLEAANPFGIADGAPTRNAAATDEEHAEYKALAIADARDQIETVPGSGAILGVAMYRGKGYAFRNNVGGTAAAMWRSSAAGWVACEFGTRIDFDAGTEEIPEGSAVMGGTSGATATVRRVVVQTGDFGSQDATGYLILTGITGTFQNDETIEGLSGSVVSDGTAQAITLPPGGRYDFRVHNFYGHSATKRLYFTNGVGFACEYQDSPEFLCPLVTGMGEDTPGHLAVHKSALWLSFPGGSVQKSGAADPASWRVVTGAAELGTGDDITGFLEEIGGTLFVMGRNSISYINGDEASGFAMDKFPSESGAREWGLVRIGKGVFLDDRGFTTLAASERFGNFASASVSEQIQPLVEALRPLLACAVVSRTRNRARFFFTDTRFITIGFTGDKITGYTTSDYGIPIRCAHSGEGADGEEAILMGSDDGYVYEADKGTSFDGAEIDAFLRPVFHHSRSPSRVKRYRLADVDVDTKGPTTLKVAVDYSYADPSSSGEPIRDVTMRGGGGFWGAAVWGLFRWGAGVVAKAKVKLEGSGYNIGLLFSHTSATEESHRLAGVTFHLSQRRLNRSTA